MLCVELALIPTHKKSGAPGRQFQSVPPCEGGPTGSCEAAQALCFNPCPRARADELDQLLIELEEFQSVPPCEGGRFPACHVRT